MGSMSIFYADVVCLRLVCMTCSLLMLLEDARGDDVKGILQSRYHDCLIGRNECFLRFTPSCCGEFFY